MPYGQVKDCIRKHYAGALCYQDFGKTCFVYDLKLSNRCINSEEKRLVRSQVIFTEPEHKTSSPFLKAVFIIYELLCVVNVCLTDKNNNACNMYLISILVKP